MRIVSGFLKGKKLDFLKTNTTRPLRDFVKESTFNVIDHSNLIDISLKNAIILDLYSGVGSFGIECISRGAKKTTFVENDTSALAVLEKNIELLKIEKKTSIQKTKIISFLKQAKIDDEYEIIFFDPPFSEDYFLEELKIIKNSNIYKTNHLVVIHRDKKSKDDFSGIVNIFMTKKYGRSKILFGNFKLNTV
tara:strand:- start:2566 stop:3141 length:576 start_codon:yes stop_codon:yes gene_type:complete